MLFVKNNISHMSDRNVRIYRINRKYDSKIYQVKHNRYMNNRQKKRAIKGVEQARQWDIRQMYANYNNRKQYQRGEKHNNRHPDYDSNDRYSKQGRYEKERIALEKIKF